MTANIIQAKYDQLDAVAARFGQRSEASEALQQRVAQNAEALEDGGWEGHGATAFFTEMNGALFPALQRLQQALDDAQAVTLEAKDILPAAEGEAAALFGGEAGALASFAAGGAGDRPMKPFDSPFPFDLPIPPWERKAADVVGEFGSQALDFLLGKFTGWLNDSLPEDVPGETEKVTFNISQGVTGMIPGIAIPLGLEGDKTITVARSKDGRYEVTIKAATGAGPDVDVASAGAGSSAEVTYRFDPNDRDDMTEMAATLAAFGAASPFLNGFMAAGVASIPSADHIVSARGDAALLGELGLERGGLSGDASGANELGVGVKRNDKGELEVETYVGLQREGKADIHPSKLKIDEHGAAGRVELAVVHNQHTGEDSVRLRVTRITSSADGAGVSAGVSSVKGVSTQATTTTREYTFDKPIDDVRAMLADGSASEADLRAASSGGRVTETTGEGHRGEVSGKGKGFRISSEAGVTHERERGKEEW